MAARRRPQKKEPAPHPLRTWLTETKTTREQFAQMVAAYGISIKPEYVRHLSFGYRRPSYDLASVIDKITGGVVKVDQLLTWRRPASGAGKSGKSAA